MVSEVFIQLSLRAEQSHQLLDAFRGDNLLVTLHATLSCLDPFIDASFHGLRVVAITGGTVVGRPVDAHLLVVVGGVVDTHRFDVQLP